MFYKFGVVRYDRYGGVVKSARARSGNGKEVVHMHTCGKPGKQHMEAV